MLLYTTIKKRRSRAFKQKKVYQNRTIIKEVISKNVIFLLTLGSGPRGLDGSGPPWGWTGPDPPGIGQVRTPLGLDRSGPPWGWTGPDPPGVGQVRTPQGLDRSGPLGPDPLALALLIVYAIVYHN